MGMMPDVRKWPWVLRIAFGSALVGMAFAVFATSTESDERWMYAVAPASFMVVGLLLALDISKAASRYAETTADARPLGVDYSRSIFAKPWFARVFGIPLILIGGAILFVALTQPL